MWIVQWLVDRFSKLVTLLDVVFAPIIQIVNNVLSWIANAVFGGEQRTQIFAINRDFILDFLLRQFTNLLHNLGIADTDVKVGAERQTRTQQAALADMKANKIDFDAKAALAAKAQQLEALTQAEAKKAEIARVKGDGENRDFIDQLRDTFLTFRGNFDGWFNLVGDLLTRFAQDPIGFIAAILFEVVLEIVIYQLAAGLARPGLDIGEPPTFGNRGNGGIQPPPPGGTVRIGVVSPLSIIRGTGLTYSYPAHPGVDLIGKQDAPVLSAQSGKVARLNRDDPVLGNILTVSDGHVETVYYGLKTINVTLGQTVNDKTILGTLGLFLHGKQNALHFEVRIGGVAVDPLPIMKARN